jgi:hypothetical protein
MSKINSANRRNFLLGFFGNTDKDVLELNGFVLFRHWDGHNNRWTVDIFTPESYQAMKLRISPRLQKETLF